MGYLYHLSQDKAYSKHSVSSCTLYIYIIYTYIIYIDNYMHIYIYPYVAWYCFSFCSHVQGLMIDVAAAQAWQLGKQMQAVCPEEWPTTESNSFEAKKVF